MKHVWMVELPHDVELFAQALLHAMMPARRGGRLQAELFPRARVHYAEALSERACSEKRCPRMLLAINMAVRFQHVLHTGD